MPAGDVLVAAARQLADACEALSFAPPVAYTYNPLRYAWNVHEAYLRKYGGDSKRVVFLGMNPGPYGMAQTGVPFGEIAAVLEWMGLSGDIDKPSLEHPKRPVTGFACTRSEVSGRRLWGAFAERFGTPQAFFQDHFVINYCPLVFMEESGRNHTPDKLPERERTPLELVCDHHLKKVVRTLQPEWVIGVGAFARKRVEETIGDFDVQIGQILHPSPASPAANRGWAEAATKQLIELGVWSGSIA